jgi:hypothetical protein
MQRYTRNNMANYCRDDPVVEHAASATNQIHGHDVSIATAWPRQACPPTSVRMSTPLLRPTCRKRPVLSSPPPTPGPPPYKSRTEVGTAGSACTHAHTGQQSLIDTPRMAVHNMYVTQPAAMHTACTSCICTHRLRAILTIPAPAKWPSWHTALPSHLHAMSSHTHLQCQPFEPVLRVQAQDAHSRVVQPCCQEPAAGPTLWDGCYVQAGDIIAHLHTCRKQLHWVSCSESSAYMQTSAGSLQATYAGLGRNLHCPKTPKVH